MADARIPTATSIAQLAAAVRQSSDGAAGVRWRVRLPDVRRLARVELEQEWLSIRVPERASKRPLAQGQIAALLERNAALGGAARIVGRGLSGCLERVVEIPRDALDLDDDGALATAIEAHTAAAGAAAEPDPAPATPPGGAAEPDRAAFWHPDWTDALAEHGWPVRGGADDEREIPLDVPATYIAARIRCDSGDVRLTVPLLGDAYPSAAGVNRAAVDALLWLIAGGTRMVAPMRVGRAPALGVRVPADESTPIAVAHGCAALSVALQHFVPAADRLIDDEHLALVYLQTIGFNPDGARPQPLASPRSKRLTNP